MCRPTHRPIGDRWCATWCCQRLPFSRAPRRAAIDECMKTTILVATDDNRDRRQARPEIARPGDLCIRQIIPGRSFENRSAPAYRSQCHGRGGRALGCSRAWARSRHNHRVASGRNAQPDGRGGDKIAGCFSVASTDTPRPQCFPGWFLKPRGPSEPDGPPQQ